MGDERIPQIRRRLINFTTERWDSLAHHREDAEEFHGHAAGDILWLLDEIDRLRAIEAAARAVAEEAGWRERYFGTAMRELDAVLGLPPDPLVAGD